MKKKALSLIMAVSMIATLLPAGAFASTEKGENTRADLLIDEENFPDEEFRNAIAEEYDTGYYIYDQSINDYSYVGANDGKLSEKEIEKIKELHFSDENIENLTGVEHFTSLIELSITDSNLRILNELPSNLVDLRCYGNELTSLPKLPDTLKVLWCQENNLTSLPQLPGKLKELACSNNKLVSLPILPDALRELDCSQNKDITELPTLPGRLKVLNCQGNSLRSVQALPSKLISINLEKNKIEGTLDLSRLDTLSELYLYDNLLTEIILSPVADYDKIDLGYNRLENKGAITGRDDILWSDHEYPFRFGSQKSYCFFHGHNLGKKTVESKVYVSQKSSIFGGYNSKCTRCDYTRWSSIPAVKNIKLSETSYTFDGKAKKPTVTVYGEDDKKVSSSNYKVVYSSDRKNVGKYKATVNFKGSCYKGCRYVVFCINPKPTTISSVSSGSESFTVKWKKQSAKMSKSRITGYQYRYSTSNKMTDAKRVTVKGYSNTSAKKTGLDAGQKYYVQVRTYMKVNGSTCYSSWSKAKSITTR